AKLAGSFVKVVLSGAGGDELFAGYPWRYYRAAVNADFDDYARKYFGFWQRLVPDAQSGSFFGPIAGDVAGYDPRDTFVAALGGDGRPCERLEDYLTRSRYFEARTVLHGLLVVEDKLSMAHGLETRLPFLDNDLVDFAMRAPVRLKLGNLGEVVRSDENT